MPKALDVISVMDLRQDAAAALKRVGASKHERQILRLLARGEREIAKARGYDLEDVLAEAAQIPREPLPGL